MNHGMRLAQDAAWDRYKVARCGFWWRVQIGNGTLKVGRYLTKIEAERMAATLRGAFLDGAFVATKGIKQ